MTMIREPETWHEDWCNFTPDEFKDLLLQQTRNIF